MAHSFFQKLKNPNPALDTCLPPHLSHPNHQQYHHLCLQSISRGNYFFLSFPLPPWPRTSSNFIIALSDCLFSFYPYPLSSKQQSKSLPKIINYIMSEEKPPMTSHVTQSRSSSAYTCPEDPTPPHCAINFNYLCPLADSTQAMSGILP